MKTWRDIPQEEGKPDPVSGHQDKDEHEENDKDQEDRDLIMGGFDQVCCNICTINTFQKSGTVERSPENMRPTSVPRLHYQCLVVDLILTMNPDKSVLSCNR